MILVDSSVWIEHLRNTGNAMIQQLDVLLEFRKEEIVTHPLVVVEVLQGVPTDRSFVETKKFFRTLQWLNIGGVEIYEEAAKLYRQCRHTGLTIRSTIDCILAVSAVRNDCEVFSLDRDFEQIAKVCAVKIYGTK